MRRFTVLAPGPKCGVRERAEPTLESGLTGCAGSHRNICLWALASPKNVRRARKMYFNQSYRYRSNQYHSRDSAPEAGANTQ